MQGRAASPRSCRPPRPPSRVGSPAPGAAPSQSPGPGQPGGGRVPTGEPSGRPEAAVLGSALDRKGQGLEPRLGPGVLDRADVAALLEPRRVLAEGEGLRGASQDL